MRDLRPAPTLGRWPATREREGKEERERKRGKEEREREIVMNKGRRWRWLTGEGF